MQYHKRRYSQGGEEGLNISISFKPPSVSVLVGDPKVDILFRDRIIRDGSSLEPYTGDYTVTPMVEVEQTLETNGLRMTDDITVLKIPYFETTNLSGGYTAIIGG